MSACEREPDAGTNDISVLSRPAGMKTTSDRHHADGAAMIATPFHPAAARAGSGDAARFAAADWLSLAAAPTFAIMAMLTGAFGGGAPDMLCSASHGPSPLGGMVPMYLLMSAFHMAPWLKRISLRRGGVRQA